jgi:hypothetical protein
MLSNQIDFYKLERTKSNYILQDQNVFDNRIKRIKSINELINEKMQNGKTG